MKRAKLHARPPQRGQSGFTLFELLVALSLTIIGLVGLLSLHLSTLNGNKGAERISEATAIAQRTMEELRSYRLDGGENSIEQEFGQLPIVDAPLTTGDGPVEFGRTGTAKYYRQFSVVELNAISEDLVRFRVEILWAEGGGDPDPASATPAPPELIRRVALELIRTRQEAL